MASSVVRRPLPALIALVALLVLTGLVWWRVLHRGTSTDHKAQPCPTPTARSTLPAPASITVIVLNATNRSGIATKARRSLIADGFRSDKPPGNARRGTKVPGTALIAYGSRGKQAATLLRYYLPGSTLIARPNSSATVVVYLGKKFTQVASSATVTKTLARAKIAVAGATPSPTPSGSAGC